MKLHHTFVFFLLAVPCLCQSQRLATTCGEWPAKYLSQLQNSQARPCVADSGSSSRYCCSLYARMNTAIRFFVTAPPKGLGCKVNGDSTVFAQFYHANCKNASSIPIEIPSASPQPPSPSPQPSPAPTNAGSIIALPAAPGNPANATITPTPGVATNATLANDTVVTSEGEVNSTDASNSTDTDTNGTTPVIIPPGNITEVGAPNASAPTAREDPAKTDGSVCLHGSLLVQLQHGLFVRVDELRVGDMVESTTGGHFSEIYMFTHASKERSDFVNLTTSRGSWVAVTPGHLVRSNDGKLVRGGDIRVGDVLLGDHHVVEVSNFVDEGIYNPHTLHGDIVVNGVQTSSYTTAVEANVAHSALSIFRALWHHVRWYTVALRCGMPSSSSLMGNACTA